MRVELGNRNPTAPGAQKPAVTYVNVPESYTYEVADSAEQLATDVMREVVRGGGVTHLPDQEAILAVSAAWNNESSGSPAWVWSDNEDFAVLLGHFFGAPVGRPDDVEQTHHTNAGPPGVGPVASPEGETA